jgi:oligoribonuclease NrnB/cAMP/cGMP phosphodiesterase (DHH superfamily)
MKTLIALFAAFLVLSFSTDRDLEQVKFLEGIWKNENKDTYEVWKKNPDDTMEGYSYKMKAGEKVVSEYLSIKMIDGNLTYQAIVPDQNNGQTISFVLNKAVKDQLSFENLSHDFPKKIQYKSLDAVTILVSVLGDEDKGFQFKAIKQPRTTKQE